MQERIFIPPRLGGRVWICDRVPDRRAPHTHVDVEMNLVLSGRAAYLMGKRRYELVGRGLVWLFPAQPHVLVDGSPDFSMWIVVFRPQLVRQVAKGARYERLCDPNPAGHFCKVVSRADADWLGMQCREVCDCMGDPALCNVALRHLLLSAWDRYLRAGAVADHAEVHPAVELAARMIQDGTVSGGLTDMAGQVHLSSSRLSRLFRRQVGMPMVQFRNRVRIEEFLKVYGQGQRSTMLASALEVGFGSYAQFFRVFKSVMGISPWEYAARAKGLPADSRPEVSG